MRIGTSVFLRQTYEIVSQQRTETVTTLSNKACYYFNVFMGYRPKENNYKTHMSYLSQTGITAE